MGGASLWLVPPKHHHHIQHHLPHLPHPHAHKKSHSRDASAEISKSHHLDTILSTLITSTVPGALPTGSKHPQFVPHITLTSDIDLASLKPSPEKWLERLAIPQAADVKVMFKEVGTGSTFTKKAFLRVHKTGIEGLGELARWQGVEGGSSGPGSSSGGGGKDVDGTDAAERWIDGWDPHVSLLYSDIDISDELHKQIEDLVVQSGIAFDGHGELSGWTGGSLWLVPTSKPINEWKPLAERKLIKDDDY